MKKKEYFKEAIREYIGFVIQSFLYNKKAKSFNKFIKNDFKEIPHKEDIVAINPKYCSEKIIKEIGEYFENGIEDFKILKTRYYSQYEVDIEGLSEPISPDAIIIRKRKRRFI